MKILMIGLGGIGQRHLRNLKQLLGDELEVCAYRVRRQNHVLTDKLEIAPAENIEEKYAISVFSDLTQALEQKPDAAFICNPNSFHIPVALECARWNVAMFLEKPIAHNMDGVEELIEIVESQNLVALVGYQMRFHPCLRALRECVQNRSVGRIVSVQAEVGEYLPNWHRYEDYRQMYASRADLGGGVVVSQIHELDYLYSLFGLPNRVFAIGGKLSHLEIDVEDVVSALLETEVEGQNIPIQLHQDYVQRPPSRKCRIVGDDGKIEVDFVATTIKVWNRDGEIARDESFPDFQRNQLFLDQTEHFLNCLKGAEKPLVSLRDGAASLKMALAIKESFGSGQVVSL